MTGHLCKAENQKAESQKADFKRQKIKWQKNQKAENRKAEIIVVIILYYKSISTTLRMIERYECR